MGRAYCKLTFGSIIGAFYTPFWAAYDSNEILYTKALEYKEYFTHIAVQQMTKMFKRYSRSCGYEI
jgi:hypothetical protein